MEEKPNEAENTENENKISHRFSFKEILNHQWTIAIITSLFALYVGIFATPYAVIHQPPLFKYSFSADSQKVLLAEGENIDISGTEWSIPLPDRLLTLGNRATFFNIASLDHVLLWELSPMVHLNPNSEEMQNILKCLVYRTSDLLGNESGIPLIVHINYQYRGGKAKYSTRDLIILRGLNSEIPEVKVISHNAKDAEVQIFAEDQRKWMKQVFDNSILDSQSKPITAPSGKCRVTSNP